MPNFSHFYNIPLVSLSISSNISRLCQPWKVNRKCLLSVKGALFFSFVTLWVLFGVYLTLIYSIWFLAIMNFLRELQGMVFISSPNRSENANALREVIVDFYHLGQHNLYTHVVIVIVCHVLKLYRNNVQSVAGFSINGNRLNPKTKPDFRYYWRKICKEIFVWFWLKM